MELNNARILLTGATGGLGQALARALAEQGADLLLAGRDEERLAACVSGLGGTGRIALGLRADLNLAEDIAKTAEAARAFGVDVLINNAGVNAFGLYEQQDWRTLAQVMATNLIAPMQLTHALLPWLKGRERAAIVNIGSTFGSLPFPGFAAYSGAKAGLRGFSQALRRELADSRVAVVHVAPRAIATALNSAAVNALNHALGSQSDSPEAAARQIVAALRGGRGESHFGFPERLFAWLNGCAPALIDQALKAKLAIVKRHAIQP
ncbi:MAG: short chain dehydrogenase [Hydrogenophilales bacterium 28-61-23]|nr:MAG: short chain dehydrogenase [Hydrogenophilales bacterium 28-61-23]